uniref:DNA binding protein VP4 n=1 Tax=Gokushovirinae environmental samples TaxID=1478972 RepID=A0A2R3UA99_9VIRU|nr:DNA binding protein VP4 [Gokushovirinae environmental samples]
MKLQILATMDSAAGAYMRPFFVPSIGVGIRSFADEVNRPSAENVLYQHPEHFSLFHLGSWNDEDGRFDLLKVPVILSQAVSLRMEVPNATVAPQGRQQGPEL